MIEVTSVMITKVCNHALFSDSLSQKYSHYLSPFQHDFNGTNNQQVLLFRPLRLNWAKLVCRLRTAFGVKHCILFDYLAESKRLYLILLGSFLNICIRKGLVLFRDLEQR